MSKNIWLRTDEHIEAIKAFEAFYSNLTQVRHDCYYWKWAIITLHNSVQGFMVCALRGTNNLTILNNRSREEWLEAYKLRVLRYPEEKLDDFVNLYKKIKGSCMDQFIYSQRFVPKGQQSKSMKRLNTLRNEFIHFIPKGLSLEVSGLPKICSDALGVIEFLATHSGNIHFYSKPLERKYLETLAKSKSYLAKISKTYQT